MKKSFCTKVLNSTEKSIWATVCCCCLHHMQICWKFYMSYIVQKYHIKDEWNYILMDSQNITRLLHIAKTSSSCFLLASFTCTCFFIFIEIYENTAFIYFVCDLYFISSCHSMRLFLQFNELATNANLKLSWL